MKKNIVIIVLSVVALLLAGTVGYLIAEKVVSNKYENVSSNNNKDNVINTGAVNLELNSFLVASLTYPMNIVNGLGYRDYWLYKNVTVDSLDRNIMMINASRGLLPTYSDGSASYYSAYQIKNNFVKIYGPDFPYYDGDLSGGKCATLSKYDSEKNVYIEYPPACGGATNSWIDFVTKKYKAEQDGDYIYVYEYVQSVLTVTKDNDEMVVYLLGKGETLYEVLDSDYESKYKILSGANKSNYESIIEQMMDKGEVDTYKWTFKKQSDGKYYFYSGAWEN